MDYNISGTTRNSEYNSDLNASGTSSTTTSDTRPDSPDISDMLQALVVQDVGETGEIASTLSTESSLYLGSSCENKTDSSVLEQSDKCSSNPMKTTKRKAVFSESPSIPAKTMRSTLHEEASSSKEGNYQQHVELLEKNSCANNKTLYSQIKDVANEEVIASTSGASTSGLETVKGAIKKSSPAIMFGVKRKRDSYDTENEVSSRRKPSTSMIHGTYYIEEEGIEYINRASDLLDGISGNNKLSRDIIHDMKNLFSSEISEEEDGENLIGATCANNTYDIVELKDRKEITEMYDLLNDMIDIVNSGKKKGPNIDVILTSIFNVIEPIVTSKIVRYFEENYVESDDEDELDELSPPEALKSIISGLTVLLIKERIFPK